MGLADLSLRHPENPDRKYFILLFSELKEQTYDLIGSRSQCGVWGWASDCLRSPDAHSSESLAW